ncbi:hypothetical protein CEXT_415091 [Caerostris extrusa]|uniref:Uncharacterized protein n=1 Tax=Caerostris extrusa TaxID=172846 RepID=A0AAV4NXA4_CAEEX|nr:hypothetical protein CEXT_415091 [Caerostris extrusa]
MWGPTSVRRLSGGCLQHFSLASKKSYEATTLAQDKVFILFERVELFPSRVLGNHRNSFLILLCRINPPSPGRFDERAISLSSQNNIASHTCLIIKTNSGLEDGESVGSWKTQEDEKEEDEQEKKKREDEMARRRRGGQRLKIIFEPPTLESAACLYD